VLLSSRWFDIVVRFESFYLEILIHSQFLSKKESIEMLIRHPKLKNGNYSQAV